MKLPDKTAAKRCTRPDALFGLWCIEPRRFAEMFGIVQSIDLTAHVAAAATNPDDAGPAVSEIVGGVCVVNISGPITKYSTSFQEVIGGTSTVAVQRAIREAVSNGGVNQILLHIDSPGGSVAGVPDLAEEIYNTRYRKPVYAYIEDIGASAGYWLASQAHRVFANSNAIVGSIGTMTRLVDTSGAYDKAGVKVHVVKAGQYKGIGVEGAPVTDEQLAEVQREIDSLNALFIAGVARGRGLSMEKARALADGRVHIGAQAQALGLIDGVRSLDTTMTELRKATLNSPTTNTATAQPVPPVPSSPPAPSRPSPTNPPSKEKPTMTDKILTAAGVPIDPDVATPDELKAHAAKEWSANKGDCRATFRSKENFVHYRIAELQGRVRVYGGIGKSEGPQSYSTREPDKISADDAKTQAKREWAENFEGCHSHFTSERNYMGYRVAELQGRIGIYKRATN